MGQLSMACSMGYDAMSVAHECSSSVAQKPLCSEAGSGFLLLWRKNRRPSLTIQCTLEYELLYKMSNHSIFLNCQRFKLVQRVRGKKGKGEEERRREGERKGKTDLNHLKNFIPE